MKEEIGATNFKYQGKEAIKYEEFLDNDIVKINDTQEMSELVAAGNRDVSEAIDVVLAQINKEKQEGAINRVDSLADFSVFAREFIKELSERGDTDFNFKIEFIKNNQEVLLALVTDDNKRINLNNYLPFLVSFKESNGFLFNAWSGKVSFKKTENLSVFLLSLFHEIGHSIEPQKTLLRTELDKDQEKRLKNDLRKNTFRVFNANRKNFGFFKALGSTMFSSGDSIYPLWLKELEHKNLSEGERGAWRFSLRQMRMLEKEGIDVFAGFKSNKEIIAFIESCLATYESAKAIDEHQPIINDDDYVNSENYQPMYAKKVVKKIG